MLRNSALRLIQRFPIAVPVAGRRRNAVMTSLDGIMRRAFPDEVARHTELGSISLDMTHEPERLLAYLFENVLRYYGHSPLGSWINRSGQPGTTFVDVGANLGMFTLIARQRGMRTVVVEPEPRHSAFLARNAHLFGTVLPVAFSDSETSLPLFYEAGNPGATSLLRTPGYVEGDQSVRVTTFSAAAERGELGPPSEISIVKIDVEGFEEHAVRGMCKFLDHGHRPTIWCEVRGDSSGRNGGSYRRVREVLASFGYSMHAADTRILGAADEGELARRSVYDVLFVS